MSRTNIGTAQGVQAWLRTVGYEEHDTQCATPSGLGTVDCTTRTPITEQEHTRVKEAMYATDLIAKAKTVDELADKLIRVAGRTPGRGRDAAVMRTADGYEARDIESEKLFLPTRYQPKGDSVVAVVLLGGDGGTANLVGRTASRDELLALDRVDLDHADDNYRDGHPADETPEARADRLLTRRHGAAWVASHATPGATTPGS
jgi:hypothetical protein